MNLNSIRILVKAMARAGLDLKIQRVHVYGKDITEIELSSIFKENNFGCEIIADTNIPELLL